MNCHSEEALIRNLKDAGCDPDTMARFMDCYKKGDYQNQIRMLEICRDALLENVHQGEKKISCLDYLVYQIERQHKL